MEKLTVGKKHEKFVMAIKDGNYDTARKLAKNSFKADRKIMSDVETFYSKLEQGKKDILWNYFAGYGKKCLSLIPKQKSKSVTSEASSSLPTSE